MTEWWNNLSLIEMIFAYIAIPSTVLLALQTIMLIFGLGSSGDGDVDDAGEVDDGGDSPESNDSGLRVFTVRGLVAFFTIFGWAGLAFLRGGMNAGASVLVAFVLGTISLFVVAISIKVFLNLQSDGSISINNAIGKSGVVYLTIPPSRMNNGKVSIVVQERLCEYDAVTDFERELKTGTEVTVTSISNKNMLVVIPK